MSLPAELESFLKAASRTTLQDFELASLDRAANLRKEIERLHGKLIEEEANALMARMVREIARELETGVAVQQAFEFVSRVA